MLVQKDPCFVESMFAQIVEVMDVLCKKWIGPRVHDDFTCCARATMRLSLLIIECFRGWHRGRRNFTSSLRFSGPVFHAAGRLFSTLKLAPPMKGAPWSTAWINLRKERRVAFFLLDLLCIDRSRIPNGIRRCLRTSTQVVVDDLQLIGIIKSGDAHSYCCSDESHQ